MLGLVAEGVHGQCAAGGAEQERPEEEQLFGDAAGVGLGAALVDEHGEERDEVHHQQHGQRGEVDGELVGGLLEKFSFPFCRKCAIMSVM